MGNGATWWAFASSLSVGRFSSAPRGAARLATNFLFLLASFLFFIF
jgi:hypothetical protein